MKLALTYLLTVVTIYFSMISCSSDDNIVEPGSSERIEKNIKAVLDSVIENTHVPGLVAGIWAPNEGVDLVYTAGVANLETGEPLSAEMIFRIGSNTKTFTNTVLLQLVDEGLISLDEKLSGYFPDYPRADEVTIEMLTNMRSGIFNYTELENFWSQITINPTKMWNPEELISSTQNQEYYFNPGTGFHYSNTNTIMIGKIIEMITGRSLESNIGTRIISRLNLINTTYLIAGTEIPGYHSKAYYAGEYDSSFPECSELIDVSWAGAAGSMLSDIYELKTYSEALAGGTFLSDQLQAQRLNCFDAGSSIGLKYGMGIFEYKGFYGHNGGMPGYTSLMVNSPERNCTIIVWYNCQLETTPTELLTVIPQLIFPDL